MDLHSHNPRIPFDITSTDAASDVIPPHMHDKSHVIISLMQDYRQGTRTSNSMLLAIGFCVYKVTSYKLKKSLCSDDKLSVLIHQHPPNRLKAMLPDKSIVCQSGGTEPDLVTFPHNTPSLMFHAKYTK